MWVTFPAAVGLGFGGLWAAVGVARPWGSGLSGTWLAGVALTAADAVVALGAFGLVADSRGGDGNGLWTWSLAGAVVAFWAWVRSWLVPGAWAAAAWMRREKPGRWAELRSGWGPWLLLPGGAGTVMTALVIGLADAAGRPVWWVAPLLGDLLAMAILAVFFRCYVSAVTRCLDAGAGEREAPGVCGAAAGADSGGEGS